MRKKLAAIILVTMMVASLEGCSGGTTETGSTASENAASEDTVQMSDDLSDCMFTLDGVVYQLPFKFSELTENGWTYDEEDIEKDEEDLKQLTMSKDNETIDILALVKSEDGDVEEDVSVVVGIAVDNIDGTVDFSIAQGITLDLTEEELRNAFGEPTEYDGYDDENTVIKMKYYDENEEVYTTFMLSMVDDTVAYTSISIDNYDTADLGHLFGVDAEETTEYEGATAE